MTAIHTYTDNQSQCTVISNYGSVALQIEKTLSNIDTDFHTFITFSTVTKRAHFQVA